MADRGDVEIGIFGSGDERPINDLFNRIFCASRSLDQWRWKFQRNPARLTNPTRIVLGRLKGHIVSQYAGVARDMLLNGKVRTVTEIVDNLIDPDFRAGRRLQNQMIAYYAEQVLREGNDFTLGCPNDIAYRVGKRLLAYDDLFFAPRLFRRLSPRLALQTRFPRPLRPLAEPLGRLGALVMRWALRPSGGCRFRVANTLDNQFDRFWQEAKERFVLIGIRDREYLQWRYMERPDTRFRLICADDDEGMKAWIVLNMTHKPDGRRTGYIVDFLYRDYAIMRQLFRHGLCELSRMGADHAVTLAAPGSAGDGLVRSVGFSERPGYDPVRLVIRWLNMQDAPSQSAVLDPQNWHLCYGDLDLEL